MDKSEIQKLRELPIEGVAERLGLKVSKHKSLCPFHEDSHPSLSFRTTSNSYKCFVCDSHGGPIDLVMGTLKLNFVDACKWLANENNIILTEFKPAEKSLDIRPSTFDPNKYLRYFQHPFINDLAADFLFNRRHLDPRVVSWCRLNSYKEWLQIPYFDINGNLIGVQSRYLGKDKSQPRFRFPYGSNCPIYNLPVLKMLKPHEPLYITEGASDCWSMLSSGHKAIAIPSATLLTKKNLKLLEPLKLLETPLQMYPDADIPGEKLYLQLTQLSLSLGLTLIRHSLPQGCKDYSDYYISKHS